MNIGELAHLTGLTVKALRHYDETAVIVPAHVDPVTRYRSYAAGQVRDALVVNALRSAGVGLPEIRAALTEGTDVDVVLDAHRLRIDAERAAQDAAESAARELAAALRIAPPVVRRSAPPQRYAGVVLTLGDDWDTQVDEVHARAEADLEDLWTALADSGNPPVGAYWTTFRSAGPVAGRAARTSRPASSTAQAVLTWPIERDPGAGWQLPGRATEVGVLPRRTELAVRWLFDDPEGASAAVHPAVVALLEAIDDEDGEVDVSQVRQVALIDADGEQTGVEIVFTTAPAAG